MNMELNIVVTILVALGIAVVFVVAWILRSEKAKSVYAEEMESLKEKLESNEEEKLRILEQMEDAGDDASQSDSQDELEEDESEDYEEEEVPAEMTNRLKILEDENENLKMELDEAKESLEEVYRAVHEEGEED